MDVFLTSVYTQKTCSLTSTPRLFFTVRFNSVSSRSVVIRLYKHTEPFCGFPRFFRTPFLTNTTENTNGLRKSDDLRRTPETAPSNPRGSIEPSLTTAGLASLSPIFGEHKTQTCAGVSNIYTANTSGPQCITF